jgi:hypothetical protein
MQQIVFGGEKYERLEISIADYEREASGDYHDDNWLKVNVSVAAGAFRGSFDATFQAVELLDLCTDLSQLYETLSGRVRFETLEDQLSLEFVGNGQGSIELLGEALDQAGVGNKLIFALQLDQTQLNQSVQALKTAVAAFQVRT